jgi:pimeloyl-ACP methyl ester carboxylesterase
MLGRMNSSRKPWTDVPSPGRRPVPGTAPALLAAAALALGSLALSALLASPAARADAPAAPRASFVEAADGVPLCVYETGNPQGRELLLIHGYSQSYAVFRQQFDSSLGRDYRIVAFDLRGHGCSGKPWKEEAYTGTRVWADDVATVIRATGLRRPVVVGWSFGGYIAAHYARHYGVDGIAGIVLVGSNAGLPPEPTDPAILERLARLREGKRDMVPDVDAQIANGRNFVKMMTAGPAPAAMQETMFAANQMLPVYAQRAMWSLALSNQDVIPALRTRVLFLVGSKDGSQSVEVLRTAAATLPDGHVEVIEGSGHAPFIDAPAEFDARLRAFVEATVKR